MFPEPDVYPLSETNIEGLDGFDILLFGYWTIPDGTAAETARQAHETEADAILYEMAGLLSHAGAKTDIQLHFGPAGTVKEDLQDRIIAEADVDAVLTPQTLSQFNNILVPIRGDRKLDEITAFLAGFDKEMLFILELYHAASSEEAAQAARPMLKDVKRQLLDQGFEDQDIEITVVVSDSTRSTLVEKARGHNIVVIGGTEGLENDNWFFGPIYESLVEETETPIAVVLE